MELLASNTSLKELELSGKYMKDKISMNTVMMHLQRSVVEAKRFRFWLKVLG